MITSRIVVLGAGGVGKSSLVLQYLQRRFPLIYTPTIEDCYNQTVQLPNGMYHAIEILDTSGTHHFPAMRELSIRSGRAFIVVFAINNEQSFYEAQELCKQIKKIKDSDYVPVAVVGNKNDLPEERVISWHMACDYVSCNVPNGTYLETSAKFNLSIDMVFRELLMLSFESPRQEKLLRPSRMSISIGDMSFPSYWRKSSSTCSSTSSNATLMASSGSYSDYSFNPELYEDSSSSTNSNSPSPPTRKQLLKKYFSPFASDSSSVKLHRRSASMFSQGRRRNKNATVLGEGNEAKCVFL